MSQETFHRQTATYLAKFAECMPNLSREDMQYWIDKPSELRSALSQALVREAAELKTDQKDSKLKPWEKVWKTITLGNGLSNAEEFRAALKTAGYRIGDYANDILGKEDFAQPIATTATSVDLIVVTVGDLGFKQGATREKIYAKAKRLGLELLPAEAGPQLRLQYSDQPMNEWNVIAMEPITDSDGSLGLFSVGRIDDGRWLRSCYVDPGYVWSAGYRFVFARKVQ